MNDSTTSTTYLTSLTVTKTYYNDLKLILTDDENNRIEIGDGQNTALEYGVNYHITLENADRHYNDINCDLLISADGTVTFTGSEEEGIIVQYTEVLNECAILLQMHDKGRASIVDSADRSSLGEATITFVDEGTSDGDTASSTHPVFEWKEDLGIYWVVYNNGKDFSGTYKYRIEKPGYSTIEVDVTESVNQITDIYTTIIKDSRGRAFRSSNNIIQITLNRAVTNIAAVDANTGAALSGAKVQLIYTDDDDKEVYLADGADIDGGFQFKPGIEYTLRATEAPAGYTLPSDMYITVDPETGEVAYYSKDANGTKIDGDKNSAGTLLLEFDKEEEKTTLYDIYIAAVDENTMLSGAEFEIRDGDTVLRTGITSTEPAVIKDLETATEYTLCVTKVPDGYALDDTEKITFTIKEDGTINGYENNRININLSKTKVNFKPTVPGTKYYITYEKDGKTLKFADDKGDTEFIAQDPDTKMITGFTVGEEYTLVYAHVNTSYEDPDTFTFSVDAYGRLIAEPVADRVSIENGDSIVFSLGAIPDRDDDTPSSNTPSSSTPSGNSTKEVGSTTTNPQTGDYTNVWLWIVLEVVIGGAFFTLFFFDSKRNITKIKKVK